MPEEIKTRTELSYIFLNEAKEKSNDAKKALGDSIKKAKSRTPIRKELREEIINSAFAIILSVSALESYINMNGNNNLDDEVWEGLERLKLEKKWIVFPKLISGKTFNTKDQLFKKFRRIIDLRNYILHYKDYKYKKWIRHPSGVQVPGIHEHINAKNAETAYNTADKMIDKLDKLLGN